MITFWIAALGLLAATVGLFLWVLMRKRKPAMARADYDVAVFRDQLNEVERDLDRGVLAADQAEAARIEIKRRMLSAADGRDAAQEGAVSPGLRGAGLAVIAMIVPVASIAMYLMLGSPDVADQPLSARQGEIQTAQQGEHEMAGAVAKLTAQLEKDPSNAEGWMLLGRSLRTMERYSEAAEALRKGIELIGRDADALAEYAELLVVAADGAVSDAAADIFNEISTVAPGDPRIHYYLGIYRYQHGDSRGAVQSWVDLIAVSPEGAPWLTSVRERIRSTAAAADIDLAGIKPSSDLPKPPEPPEQSGPTQEDVKNAADMTPEERDEMIRSMVEGLAARLEDEPNDADGWRKLAQAYKVLGEIDKAAQAMERAVAAEQSPK
ncbi:MAG: c-type cytochrome biogenesis protein CcmI [Rhodospirillales bacterium]|jgi:cytochrome c-type biogenesis protein CcmH|nr:c-type cytochrome biogenesis protein CcmI [Rhodospirillales bacterium]